MISIEAYLIGLVILIALFMVGLYAVYKDNVLGFVASGFSAITSIVFTVLAGFGRVGNIENIPVYAYEWKSESGNFNGLGETTISSVTSYVDSSIVYLNGFISVMMVVILLFIIGRYIATITVMRRESEEE